MSIQSSDSKQSSFKRQYSHFFVPLFQLILSLINLFYQTHTHTHTMLKCSQKYHNSKLPGKLTKPHQQHTHLQIHKLAFFFVKLPPLNVLFVVDAIPGGWGWGQCRMLPPTQQASSCHVQQMHPKLSRKTTTTGEWHLAAFIWVTGTTLTCDNKGRLLRSDWEAAESERSASSGLSAFRAQ